MGLGDLGEEKKEESKERRAEEIGVDDVEDFNELKGRVGNISQRLMILEKQVDELEDSVESLTAMIEGIFTLMRGDGELVEVIVKEKDDDRDDTESKWGVE